MLAAVAGERAASPIRPTEDGAPSFRLLLLLSCLGATIEELLGLMDAGTCPEASCWDVPRSFDDMLTRACFSPEDRDFFSEIGFRSFVEVGFFWGGSSSARVVTVTGLIEVLSLFISSKGFPVLRTFKVC